jgi:hypothetical protein
LNRIHVESKTGQCKKQVTANRQQGFQIDQSGRQPERVESAGVLRDTGISLLDVRNGGEFWSPHDHGGRVLLTAFLPADHCAVVLAALGTFKTVRRSLRASGYGRDRRWPAGGQDGAFDPERSSGHRKHRLVGG